MVITRGHHFASLHDLPGASWAIFFLAGVYLRSAWALAGLFALTWLLDFSAYAWGGGSRFCFSPAYVFLLPAYSALWLAGHWYARQYQFEWRTLLPLVISVLLGAFACEVFSSGGFYFFSGRFAEPTLAEFGVRLLRYFPGYLQSLAFYVGIAAMIQGLFLVTRHSRVGGNLIG
ncbi:MAG: hypothetical protein GXP22_06405 [Gammaproteobacteria bacterium]|nr:hypothetical protein [Gammaproteobacteria bacterium]